MTPSNVGQAAQITAARPPQGDSVPAKPLTDADLVLSILVAWKGDWVPDLYRVTGVMVHSRVDDLRERGYRIECKRFGHRDYRYRLLAGADTKEGENG